MAPNLKCCSKYLQSKPDSYGRRHSSRFIWVITKFSGACVELLKSSQSQTAWVLPKCVQKPRPDLNLCMQRGECAKNQSSMTTKSAKLGKEDKSSHTNGSSRPFSARSQIFIFTGFFTHSQTLTADVSHLSSYQLLKPGCPGSNSFSYSSRISGNHEGIHQRSSMQCLVLK